MVLTSPNRLSETCRPQSFGAKVPRHQIGKVCLRQQGSGTLAQDKEWQKHPSDMPTISAAASAILNGMESDKGSPLRGRQIRDVEMV